jgi:hypothetical protein
MIYLLIAIIVLLSLTIVVLSINFRRAQLGHNKKVGEMQHIIVQLTADNDEKLAKLKLSDDLRQKLHATREQIDRDVMAMQYDLVATLVKNNLA